MGQKYAAYNAQGAITAYYDSIDSPVPDGVTAIEVTDAQWQACVSAPGQWYVSGGTLAPVPAPSAAQQLATAQASQLTLLSNACAAAIISGFTSSALGETYGYPSKTTDQQNLSASVIAALMASQAAVQWAADAPYSAGALVVVGGQLLTCVSAGPSGAAAPTPPTAAGQIVNDGSAQWELWTTPFWCESPAGVWAFVMHTSQQIQQVGLDGKAAILADMAKNARLQAQIQAVTVETPNAVATVQAIVW